MVNQQEAISPLALIQQRVSCPLLQAPAPTQQQLDALFKAAMRAPDHANLKPWRFLLVDGAARAQLGELYLAAAEQGGADLNDTQRSKLLNMPMRAPCLVVAIARIQQHPKVPAVEQRLAAGAAVQNLLLAAHAQGLGAIWRTGDMAYHPHVHRGLGLQASEELIGFIYLGTPEKLKAVPETDPQAFVRRWESAE